MIGVFLIDICVYYDANFWIFVLIDRIPNSQTFEPIGCSQSSVVDFYPDETKWLFPNLNLEEGIGLNNRC